MPARSSLISTMRLVPKSLEGLLTRAREQGTQLYVAAVSVYELFYDCLKRDAATAQQLVDATSKRVDGAEVTLGSKP